MAIDHNVIATERLMANEPEIFPLEEEVLGAMEEHDATYQDYDNSIDRVRAAFKKVLNHHLSVGRILNTVNERRKPFMSGFSVIAGNARRAVEFRIESEIEIQVSHNGNPLTSYWQCEATPLNPVTGEPMSGASANRKCPTVTIRAAVFDTPFAYKEETPATHQSERDAFIDFVGHTVELARKSTSTADSNFTATA